jgi:hypothetical protein
MAGKKDLRPGTYTVDVTRWERDYGATGRLVDWYGIPDPPGTVAPAGVVYGQTAEILVSRDGATAVVPTPTPVVKPAPAPVAIPAKPVLAG